MYIKHLSFKFGQQKNEIYFQNMPGTNNINILHNKDKPIDRLELSYSDKNTGKTDCHIALPKSPKSIHKLYPLSYKPVSSFSKGATNAWYGNIVIEHVFSASKLHLKYLKTGIYTLLVYVRKRQDQACSRT